VHLPGGAGGDIMRRASGDDGVRDTTLQIRPVMRLRPHDRHLESIHRTFPRLLAY